MKADKINTINILKTVGKIPMELISYPDNKFGNLKAESTFALMAVEIGAKRRDIASYLEDGKYEKGQYSLYLIHSS